jgi:3-oxoacyl-[acyl-carrier-protein] synthase-1
VAHALGLGGSQATVSTACSSSAKVFAGAARLIAMNLADAVVVGGVDSLCRNTLYGFASLELLSPEPCRPCAADRRGISIGEAAGFALLERADTARDHTGVQLLGVGESSDAHHMSTPDPAGAGAALAMQRALACAGLGAADIDYINLHATASAANDAMETAAVCAVFGDAVRMSGTKGWTGHALGAAGIVEAAISVICLRDGLIPGCLNTVTRDPALSGEIVLDNRDAPLRRVLSNSFGFGGSNASLVFGRVP